MATEAADAVTSEKCSGKQRHTEIETCESETCRSQRGARGVPEGARGVPEDDRKRKCEKRKEGRQRDRENKV